jgi:integrase
VPTAIASEHGDGQPLDKRNPARRRVKPVLKAARVPETIRLNDLQHTCATLLLRAGENPKIASERLGRVDKLA